MAISKDLKVVLKLVDKLSGPLAGPMGKLGKLGTLAGKVGKGLAIGIGLGITAVTALGAAMMKLYTDALPLEGIVKGFDSLTGGAKAAEAQLEKMRKATTGMVKDTTLMKNYNLAAQLVSKTFADDLPKAMEPIGRIAAATGEDVGYLMDSYTRGIGRLSPLILDNLGIQVDLTQAYEDFAAANNLVVSEMSKAEQQAALTEQVNRKLAENAALLPPVAGTAAAAFGQLKTTMGNLKDEIGLALIPAITPLIEKLGALAKEHGPKVIAWITEDFIPGLEDMAEWLGTNVPEAIDDLKQFNDEKLKPFFEDVKQFADDAKTAVKSLYDWFRNLITKIGNAINKIKAFFGAGGGGGGGWGEGRRQHGGPLPGGLAKVGEAGWEYIWNGVVIPHHLSKQLERLGMRGRGFQSGGYAGANPDWYGYASLEKEIGTPATSPKTPEFFGEYGTKAMSYFTGGGGGVSTTQIAAAVAAQATEAAVEEAVVGAIQPEVTQQTIAMTSQMQATRLETLETNKLLRQVVEILGDQATADEQRQIALEAQDTSGW